MYPKRYSQGKRKASQGVEPREAVGDQNRMPLSLVSVDSRDRGIHQAAYGVVVAMIPVVLADFAHPATAEARNFVGCRSFVVVVDSNTVLSASTNSLHYRVAMRVPFR